jgi:hypothetical protein
MALDVRRAARGGPAAIAAPQQPDEPKIECLDSQPSYGERTAGHHFGWCRVARLMLSVPA